MADSHKAFRADGFQLSILASVVSELRTVLIGFHTTMMQQPKPKIIPQWSQCLNLYPTFNMRQGCRHNVIERRKGGSAATVLFGLMREVENDHVRIAARLIKII
jgi:hypothetical protein